MTQNNRPAGALTNALDPAALLREARAVFTNQYPGAEPDALSDGPGPQMFFRATGNVAAVVNGEGVGATADSEGMIEVYFSYGMQWIPVQLAAERIEATMTGELIDLAEGIRTFGERLDANHRSWRSRYLRAGTIGDNATI
ncbi:hypothetical protein JSO19_00155 [Leucobacter sp. UCMA 4100]|uniref:hypothetical protein n=1 Tax=Leucobacter sp. UCMA 4100 TaxID=2810534 RepID=UPI0022EAEC4C|nr:hypothetical protein [Leucobacter sp. UCMA 4100]MDA3145790.1 hypothetical protein [Leucobacter sp. UCMA 4100]